MSFNYSGINDVLTEAINLDIFGESEVNRVRNLPRDDSREMAQLINSLKNLYGVQFVSRKRVRHNLNLLLNAGLLNTSEALNSIIEETSFWMQPSSGDLGFLDVGDSTGYSSNGSPSLVSGPTYSEGNIKGLSFDGVSERLWWPNLTGAGLSNLSNPWVVHGIFKCLSTPSAEGLCGNGASGASEAGWGLVVTGNTINIGVSDGTSVTTILMPHRESFPINEWVSFILEIKPDIVGNKFEARGTMSGYGLYVAGQNLRETAAVFPNLSTAVPAQAFSVGDNRGALQRLPGHLEVVVRVAGLPDGEYLADDQLWLLHNFNRSRLWSDLSVRKAIDSLRYFFMGALTDTRVGVSAKVNNGKSYNVKVLNESTRIEEGSAVLTPVNKLGKCLVTGLTANTDYIIEFHDIDTGEVSLQEGRFTTLTSTPDFNFAIAADTHWEDIDVTYFSFTAPWHLVNNVDKPKFCHWNGDILYLDPTVNTLDHFLEKAEPHFYKAKSFYLFSHMPIQWIVSDHDSVGDDEDSSSSVLTASVEFVRGTLPIPNDEFGGDSSYYYVADMPGIKLIGMDLRSEKTDDDMMSTTQMDWVKSRLTDANTENRIYMLCSDMLWDHTGSGPPSNQMWESANYIGEREDLFNHIHTEFSTVDHGFSCSGDIHFFGIDTGVNQGSFDTGGLLTVPCVHSASFYPKISFGPKGNWDHIGTSFVGGWCLVKLTDLGSTISVDFEAMDNATQSGTTLTVVMTK